MPSTSSFDETIRAALSRASASGSVDLPPDASKEKIAKVFAELTAVLLNNYPPNDGEDQVLRSQSVILTISGFTGHIIGRLAGSNRGLEVLVCSAVNALINAANTTYIIESDKET